jgi:hypothetical protein
MTRDQIEAVWRAVGAVERTVRAAGVDAGPVLRLHHSGTHFDCVVWEALDDDATVIRAQGTTAVSGQVFIAVDAVTAIGIVAWFDAVNGRYIRDIDEIVVEAQARR